MGLALDSLPNLFRRGPQTHNQRMALKTRQIRFVRRQAAASRNHRLIAPRQFLDNSMFPLAKNWFAVMLKNLLNRGSSSRFDDIVRIQKREMQSIRHQSTNGRFSRTHKADEREIANLAGTVHARQIADFQRIGTQFLRWGERPREPFEFRPEGLIELRLTPIDHLHFVVDEILFRKRFHHLFALIV